MEISRKSITFIVLYSIFIIKNVFAQMDVLSPVALFYRCYGQMVQDIPQEKNELLSAVKRGTISGEEACWKLFDSVKLNEQNLVGDNSISKSIFKTFHDLHKSWIPSSDFTTLGSRSFAGNFEVFEPKEAAYHFTNTLFRLFVPFKFAITNPSSFMGVRRSDQERNKTFYFNIKKEKRPIAIGPGVGIGSVNQKKYKTWEARSVSHGELIGLKPLDKLILPVSLTGKRANVDISKSLGGGALGTIPYLIMNGGRTHNEKSNGAALLHRRWVLNLFQDFLCRELPALEHEDIVNFKNFIDSPEKINEIDPDRIYSSKFWKSAQERTLVQENSIHPFRHGVSCQKCHGTMDLASGLTRNYFLSRSAKFLSHQNYANVIYQKKFLANKSLEEEFLTDGDRDYFKRPGSGILFYRPIGSSKPLLKVVKDMNDLGEELSKQDDFYVCSVKRYLKFFTGIDVKLSDLDFNSGAQQSSGPVAFVVEQSKKLKEHQDIRKIIKSIIFHPLYKQKGFGSSKYETQ